MDCYKNEIYCVFFCLLHKIMFRYIFLYWYIFFHYNIYVDKRVHKSWINIGHWETKERDMKKTMKTSILILAVLCVMSIMTTTAYASTYSYYGNFDIYGGIEVKKQVQKPKALSVSTSCCVDDIQSQSCSLLVILYEKRTFGWKEIRNVEHPLQGSATTSFNKNISSSKTYKIYLRHFTGRLVSGSIALEWD